MTLGTLKKRKTEVQHDVTGFEVLVARMLQTASRRMRDFSLAWEVSVRKEEYGDILLEGFEVRRDPEILLCSGSHH